MFEGFMGRHGRGFGGFGGGDRERLFDSGELRLVILALLAEKPSYGYEIIKAIEEPLAAATRPAQASSTPPSPCLKKRATLPFPQPKAERNCTP
jgi:hypothetical protein